MASDYTIKISLDDDKVKKLEEAGLGGSVTDKVIAVPVPQKNKRKFVKAFPTAVLNDDTGEITEFPQEAADGLLETILEHKMIEVIHLFMMKTYKPVAGKEIRRSIHSA